MFISGYDMGKNSILAEVTLNQQKLMNCLIVFDHFVVLGLKGLNIENSKKALQNKSTPSPALDKSNYSVYGWIP